MGLTGGIGTAQADEALARMPARTGTSTGYGPALAEIRYGRGVGRPFSIATAPNTTKRLQLRADGRLTPTSTPDEAKKAKIGQGTYPVAKIGAVCRAPACRRSSAYATKNSP